MKIAYGAQEPNAQRNLVLRSHHHLINERAFGTLVPMAKTEKLTLADVQKVSHLSRLKLSDEEMTAIQYQLSLVLENFEQIAQVNTEGVRPLFTPTDIVHTMRADVVEPFDSEKLLENAPEKSGRLFKVPPVV